MMPGDFPVTLRGLVVSGKDGCHHTPECCRIPVPWTREEKGLDHPEFLAVEWLLSCKPTVGETIMMFDGRAAQDVMVHEVVHQLDGSLDVWVGGWTHWEVGGVKDLFDKSRKYRETAAR